MLKKSTLIITLCCFLAVAGCSFTMSQFDAVLNEIGPAVSTIIQIVALVRGTTANTTPATKISADVAGIETIYNTWQTSEASAQPGLAGEIDAGFVTLNTDLNTVFAIGQVSDPNTQAKVSALISLVETAVNIAEAAIPTPQGKFMAKVGVPTLSASQLADSWDHVLVAKTGNSKVDQFTKKHQLHNHSKFTRMLSLGISK